MTIQSQNRSFESEPISRWEIVTISVVLVLALGLRFAFPERLAVEHFDEGVYASNVWFGTAKRYPDQQLYAPPLLPLEIECLFLISGPSNQWAMFPGQISGAITVLVLWWLGRSWFGPIAGCTAAGLCSLNEVHILLSRSALTDVPLGLWWLVAMLTLRQACTTGKFTSAVLAGGYVGLAWWTKYNGWMPLGLVLGAILLRAGLMVATRDSKVWTVTRTALWGWCLSAMTAGLLWLPCVWSLQTRGGYAAVMANHRRYVVGLNGWWSSLTQQASHLNGLIGPFSGLAIFISGMMLLGLISRKASRTDSVLNQESGPNGIPNGTTEPKRVEPELRRDDANDDPPLPRGEGRGEGRDFSGKYRIKIWLSISSWLNSLIQATSQDGRRPSAPHDSLGQGTAKRSNVSVEDFLPWVLLLLLLGCMTPLAGLAGLAVAGILRCGRGVLARDDGVIENRSDLAYWILIVWFCGMFLTTPLYHPYLRLTVPLLLASFLGAGLCLHLARKPLTRVREVATNPQPNTVLSPSGVRHVLISSAVLGSFFWAGSIVRMLDVNLDPFAVFAERTGLKSAANEIKEAIEPSNPLSQLNQRPAVVYVYAEPSLLFQLRLAGLDPVVPAGSLKFAESRRAGTEARVYLAIGVHAKQDRHFQDQFAAVRNRLKAIGTWPWRLSPLVSLDQPVAIPSSPGHGQEESASVELFEVIND